MILHQKYQLLLAIMKEQRFGRKPAHNAQLLREVISYYTITTMEQQYWRNSTARMCGQLLTFIAVQVLRNAVCRGIVARRLLWCVYYLADPLPALGARPTRKSASQPESPSLVVPSTLLQISFDNPKQPV